MNSQPHPSPEFSRPFLVDDLAHGPVEVTLEANAEECSQLAKRFDLVALESLSATARLSPLGDAHVQLDATFQANVVQTCSVSLEPVKDTISDAISLIFAPIDESLLNQGLDEGAGEDEEEGDQLDLPEPLVDGEIDLGELIAEELAVRINPFPRKKGVKFEGLSEDIAGEGEREHPFAALAKLKNPKDQA